MSESKNAPNTLNHESVFFFCAISFLTETDICKCQKGQRLDVSGDRFISKMQVFYVFVKSKCWVPCTQKVGSTHVVGFITRTPNAATKCEQPNAATTAHAGEPAHRTERHQPQATSHRPPATGHQPKWTLLNVKTDKE